MFLENSVVKLGSSGLGGDTVEAGRAWLLRLPWFSWLLDFREHLLDFVIGVPLIERFQPVGLPILSLLYQIFPDQGVQANQCRHKENVSGRKQIKTT